MLPIDLCFSSHFQHTKAILLVNQARAYTEPIGHLHYFKGLKTYIYTVCRYTVRLVFVNMLKPTNKYRLLQAKLMFHYNASSL